MEAIIFILTCAVAFAIWQNWRLQKQYVEFRNTAVMTLDKATKFSQVATETDKALSDRLDCLNEKYDTIKAESGVSKKCILGLTKYFKLISFADGYEIEFKKEKPIKPKTKKGKK